MIYAVSLGPGDPDMITVKGLNALKRSDDIFYPGTKSKTGTASFSYRLLSSYQLPNSAFHPFEVPMSRDRTEAFKVYDELIRTISELYAQGHVISIVSEGDISFYSTFSYVLERIQEKNLKFEMIAGIPAFIYAGSKNQIPIAAQDDKVLVLSQIDRTDEIAAFLPHYETIVVMKLSSIKDQLVSFLESINYPFLYTEFAGTAKEFTTSSVADIRDRHIPYFSILLFNRHLS